MFATGETVGLAEWIINDTCLVKICFHYSLFSRSCRYCSILTKICVGKTKNVDLHTKQRIMQTIFKALFILRQNKS